MTFKGSTSTITHQACASCKYQRRRCPSDCLLAPYFPAHQPKVFQAVHRLFGVRKLSKMLDKIDPSRHAVTMQSIIAQAMYREQFPVRGCCWVIQQLLFEIQQAEEELHAIRSHLEHLHHQNVVPISSNLISSLQKPAFMPMGVTHDLEQQSNNNGIAFDSFVTSYIEPKDNVANNPGFWGQCDDDATVDIVKKPMMLQSQWMGLEPMPVQHEPGREHDEIHGYFDTIDDRQSYIESKEGYESSSEESPKEYNDNVLDKDLKNATACFSLTSLK